MHFTLEKIEKQLAEIRQAAARQVWDIPCFRYFETSFDEALEGAEHPEFDDRHWPEFRVGEYWGGYDRAAWFRAWVTVPPQAQGQKLALRFLVGPRDGGGSTAECMLYVNGQPLQGIDLWHEQAWLPPEHLAGGRLHVALKAWSGVLQVPDRRRFKRAQLVWVDEAAERLYFLGCTVLKAARTLGLDDLRRVQLLQALEGAFQQVDFLKPGSEAFYASLAVAAEILQARLVGLQNGGEIKPRVVGIGHAHIDMAWLWRLRHTRQKAARTFTTALHLMRQYPEYCFMHSSPQLYKYIREDNPDLYAQIQARVAEGRWEVTGGMWVEADTNLTSGEALIRQFLLGRRFVRAELGVEMHTLWLPDVFGYSAALPQIARKCGMKYFLTSKISWSQFNRFPNDTFYWRGIDGTELLTHFVTTPENGSRFYTYNGQLEPDEVQGMWANYQQKEANQELLALYGWGDGGGGPTEEMLQSARGLANLPGLPQVTLGRAEAFFERLEQRLDGQELPVWDGELYLEYHRGTYTSQARNKRLNRRSEALYHEAEWLSALADVLLRRGAYPAGALRRGWELILLNQFHDILPGSSIRPVYEDSWQDYAQVRAAGEAAVAQATAALLEALPSGKGGLVVFNPLPFERGGLVELPWEPGMKTGALVSHRVQVVGMGSTRTALVEAPPAPSLGYRFYPLEELPPQEEAALLITPTRLENAFYHIELNPQGQITCLWDKRYARQVLPGGARANVFQVFEDKPLDFDAWDIDIYYRQKQREVGELLEACVEEAGPLRGVLRLTWTFSGSTITQRLTLYRSSPRIDFRTHVDWHEQHTLLKVAFPVAVRASRATYDIQFGCIERPTHWNTSWDSARFEVSAHKWVDLSEGDYGVALLNDCKYGHDVKDNLLRLTLIKSATDPDPQADQGEHEFTYSLLPHAGDWRSGGVVEEGYALNRPLRAAWLPPGSTPHNGALPAAAQFARLDSGHVLVETVKRAEDGRAEDGDAWIVRVYEYKQCRSVSVPLRFCRPLRKAVACNLVEEDEQPVTYAGDCLTFDITPFEIKTFKVWF